MMPVKIVPAAAPLHDFKGGNNLQLSFSTVYRYGQSLGNDSNSGLIQLLVRSVLASLLICPSVC
jgi:hypothetical protein